MACCEYFTPTPGGADAFTVEMPRVTFGRGTLREVGARARGRGVSRAALFTDPFLAGSAHVATVRESLAAAGVDSDVFAEVVVEPTDRGVLDAVEFLKAGRFDGVISVGGGSSMDTAKAAMVYLLHPAPFTTYFAPPVGDGVPVPGPVLPHIACPTTSGTGSETTGLAVIRILDLDTKFVIGSRHILPDEAIVDPDCTDTLPAMVVASSGFDLLSHAIECYTARAYTRWARVEAPLARPAIQGANPWSDLHAREALRLVGKHLERGVADAADREARSALSWAATLAGLAFGNSGTHLPHALSYGLTHLLREWQVAGYPRVRGAFLPHGISVVLTSPSVFRYTATAAPERHLEAAGFAGADTRDAAPDDAGEVVAGRIIDLMRATGLPNGIGAVGFGPGDAPALAASAARQRRAVANAPRDTGEADIEGIYLHAVKYW